LSLMVATGSSAAAEVVGKSEPSASPGERL